MTAIIYRGPTRGYTLTDEDVLWLARALVGEAGEDCTREEAAYHFYCWLDRFLLMRNAWLLDKWSFTSLLQAHSQPINPRWAVAGKGLCAEKDPDSNNECDAKRIAHRAYIRSLSVAQLTRMGVYQFALDAQVGKLRRPTSYSFYNFAACYLVRNQRRPCFGKSIKDQCFLPYECLTEDERRAVLKNEDGSLAKVEGGLPARTVLKTAVGILFGAAVLWAAWTLYSNRKKR